AGPSAGPRRWPKGTVYGTACSKGGNGQIGPCQSPRAHLSQTDAASGPGFPSGIGQALAIGGQNRSWPARIAACSGAPRGQRRTGAVIDGQNPLAPAACPPTSPSALAAYPGQGRTK